MTISKKKLSFVVVIENSPPSKDFSLKNLPGASKIDVIARNILALFPNDYLNLEITYYAFFTQIAPHVLKVSSLPKRSQCFDEIEIASLIKDALNEELISFPSESIDGHHLQWFTSLSFKSFISTLIDEGNTIFYLHEMGSSINEKKLLFRDYDKLLFVLGGRQDLASENESILEQFNALKINLGSISYLASTCLLSTVFTIKKIFSDNKP